LHCVALPCTDFADMLSSNRSTTIDHIRVNSASFF
jgi:hypothetical protein